MQVRMHIMGPVSIGIVMPGSYGPIHSPRAQVHGTAPTVGGARNVGRDMEVEPPTVDGGTPDIEGTRSYRRR